ncbi:SemiSWEET transporter [Candidatus Woesearchaeota archaeon]|nr:SemiSWEET transporter [Candidatus Woesearchaeota archaeon]
METKIISIIGFSAGVLTTISFVPQVVKTWKLKKTEDISFLMYMILAVGIFLWLVYGIFITDLPIIIANSISFVLTSIILVFKIKYG